VRNFHWAQKQKSARTVTKKNGDDKRHAGGNFAVFFADRGIFCHFEGFWGEI
jgi:hypothetical protein